MKARLERHHAALLAILLVAAATRIALALVDDGIFWPDEIFQSIEPAHKRAFGYALLPWEYIDGARSWLLPMLLAPLLRIGAALDGDRPRGYFVLVRLAFVAAALASSWGAYLAARKLRVPPWRALVAAALFALLPPAILLGPRAFSENVVAPLIVFGVALLCDESPSPRAVIAAGLLLGVSTIFRVQNVLVCVAAVGWLGARRRWRQAALLAGVLALCALADGALDRVTWGGWFQSAHAYWVRNVTLGYAGMMGRQPATYYPGAFVSSTGAAGVILLVLAAIGCWRARGVTALTAVYLAAYSIVGHKELRYSLPIWPLLCVLAAVGLDELARLRAHVATAAGALAVAAMAWAATTVPRLTFAAMGSAGGNARVLDHGGAYNRALAAAHDRTDLCGLKLPTTRTESGGMSWLHRRMPIYGKEDAPPVERHYYNYEIKLAYDGSATVEALGFTDCVIDPAYQWRGN